MTWWRGRSLRSVSWSRPPRPQLNVLLAGGWINRFTSKMARVD